MPVFSYEAVDRTGKTVKNKIEAVNQEEATTKLRGMGLFPTTVKEARAQKGPAEKQAPSGPATRKPNVIFGTRFNSKSLTQFTRQMATLLDAGLPIVRSLNILTKQAQPGQMKNILTYVCEDVSSGMKFSEAIDQYPKVFDHLYVNMVRAGEVGGVLDVILDRLANFREKAERISQQIVSAMIYPALIASFALLILTAIMIFIIPQFEDVFSSMDVELPKITLFLIDTSKSFVNMWYLWLAIPTSLFIIYKMVNSTVSGRHFLDSTKLRLPLFGNIIKKTSISRFCRTLGTLTGSGVPILEALNIIKGATGNAVVAKAVSNIHDNVREGESIASPMQDSKQVFDEIVISMVNVGEETGELDKMLIKVADNYEHDVDSLVAGLAKTIEPLMIVFMGGSVGFIVIALFLPMLSMVDKLGAAN